MTMYSPRITSQRYQQRLGAHYVKVLESARTLTLTLTVSLIGDYGLEADLSVSANLTFYNPNPIAQVGTASRLKRCRLAWYGVLLLHSCLDPLSGPRATPFLALDLMWT